MCNGQAVSIAEENRLGGKIICPLASSRAIDVHAGDPVQGQLLGNILISFKAFPQGRTGSGFR